MFVKILETCRTSFGTFHAGEIRQIDDETAGVLLGNVWAVESMPAEVPGVTPKKRDTVTLEVHNSEQGIQVERINNG